MNNSLNSWLEGENPTFASSTSRHDSSGKRQSPHVIAPTPAPSDLIHESQENHGFDHEHDDVKGKVETILSQNAQARNSDTVLIVKVWEAFDAIKLKAPIEKLKSLTKASTVQRIRREIQNDEARLLPTAPSVIRKRRIKEQDVKDYYGRHSDEYKAFKRYTYDVK